MSDTSPAAGRPAFTDWGLAKAKEVVSAKTPKDFKANRDVVVDKNFWRDKAGWRLEGPPAGHPQEKEYWDRIQKLFTPRDVLGRAVNRRTDALLKHEPQVQTQLLRTVTGDRPETPEETERKAEADALVSGAWDTAGIQARAKEAASITCWAGTGNHGYAFLRWWIPLRHLVKTGNAYRVTAADAAAAMKMLEVAVVMPDAAAEIVDDRTGTPAVVILDGTGDDQAAEIYYVDGEDTVIHRIAKNETTEHRLRLGGMLPIFRVEGRKFVTPEVLMQQDDVNTYNTAVKRTVSTVAMPERYIIDAQPSGSWKALAPGEEPPPNSEVRTDQGSGTRFYLVPEPRVIGASTTTELHSTSKVDPQTQGLVSNQASVTRFEPTDPEFMTKTVEWAVGVVLDSVGQGHVVNNTSALPSGKSRREARTEFEAEVQALRESLEKALRGLLRSMLFAAEAIANAVGRYTLQLRVAVDLHVDIGPALAEDIDVDKRLVDAGYLSRETAMSRAGVEDVQGEIERIEANPGAQLERRKTLASIFSTLRTAEPDADAILLARIAGYSEDEATRLFGPLTIRRDQTAAEDAEIANAA